METSCADTKIIRVNASYSLWQLPGVLMSVYKITNIPFVIILDEWDCVIRNGGNEKLVHKYLAFLHLLFKSEESKAFLALAYITGILPIKKMNVYHMHGCTAAWVLPVGIQPEGLEIKVQPKHRYAAVHVEKPFENPFVTIPSAYQALDSFMRVNGLVHTESGVIPCYETNGESMDIYIACE